MLGGDIPYLRAGKNVCMNIGPKTLLIGDIFHGGFLKTFLKMNAVCYSEMAVHTYRSTQHHNPEDHHGHLRCCEKLNS
jgi:hypothetical protein